MHPLAPDLAGWLESPETGTLIDDRLAVRGWVFAPGKQVTAVTLRMGRREYPLASGLHRADVGSHLGEPNAAQSGFEGFVETGRPRPGPAAFEIWAAFDDGTRRRCFAGTVIRPRGNSGTGWLNYLYTAALMAFNALREGRLSLSPRRWVSALRRLARQFEADTSRPKATDAAPRALPDAKEVLTRVSLARLQAFLDSGQSLDLRPWAAPRVSILLVLFNRAELTLDCLRSICEERSVPFEVVLVDNASTDRTSDLLSRLEGARIVRNADNLGFLRAVNLAATHATAPHLLFLNNDATLLPASLRAALETLEGAPDIGAVGGKLILADGSLQEAGCIVWRDGSCLGYGRGGDPTASEFNFVRDVDFCSGALLLTRADLFAQLGGFDERFAPAYYEDSDYCVRLWKHGYRTVYDPRVAALHFEFASSSSPKAAIRMQAERQQLFARTHAEWLTHQHPPGPALILTARSRRRGHRLLVVDDRVPHPQIGFGFARAAEVVTTLTHLGHDVTLYPTNHSPEAWPAIYRDIPRTVEVIVDGGPRGLAAFVAEREDYYQGFVISRPHNLQWLQGKTPGSLAGLSVIYDAEAITAVREVQRRRLSGETVSNEEEAREVAAEIHLARPAHTVIAVSEREREAFMAAGIPRVECLGNAIDPSPTQTPFEERKGILFVGAFHELSPNGDSVRWFLEHVWPRLTNHISGVPFFVIGPDPPSALLRMAGPGVHILGAVDDLERFYATCRVFVAPTRFAAGIPIKIHHAAAHGLPVVCTTLLADQLGWRSGVDLLAADTPELFAEHCVNLYRDPALWRRVREGALERIRTECSRQAFRQTLGRVVRETLATTTPTTDKPL